jgi:DNA-directed RNA polymerase specialized sigma24 family protein
VARNVIADEYRSRARSSSLRSRLGQQANDPPGALETLISADERTRLRFALRGLSGRDRQILRLSFEEGLSCAEIARRHLEPAHYNCNSDFSHGCGCLQRREAADE